jgi:hypothetical protein
MDSKKTETEAEALREYRELCEKHGLALEDQLWKDYRKALRALEGTRETLDDVLRDHPNLARVIADGSHAPHRHELAEALRRFADATDY